MKYLLDTDSVSFALRGHGEVATRIKAEKPSDLSVSAITVAELRYGADRKGSRKLHGLIDVFANAIEVAPSTKLPRRSSDESLAFWQGGELR